MIKQETLDNGLIRTYSTTNKYIEQVETGEIFVEAIDNPDKYTYKETKKRIEEK